MRHGTTERVGLVFPSLAINPGFFLDMGRSLARVDGPVSSVVELETAPVKNKVRRFSGSAASGGSLCGSLPFWQGLPCQGRDVIDWRASGKRSSLLSTLFWLWVSFGRRQAKGLRSQILDMAHLG